MGTLDNKHDALMQASSGYREWATQQIDDEEDDYMVRAFANWFLGPTKDVDKYKDDSADRWNQRYFKWNY